MAFKVGDVVMLKSGGAVMTVEVPNTATGKVLCGWHNVVSPGNFSHADHPYPDDMLELLSDVHARQRVESDEVEPGVIEEIDEP